jgi:putative membrane protein
MMGGGMMGGMAAWMFLWALVGIAILVLAVVGIVWLVRRSDHRQPIESTRVEPPEELLRRRYAAGEIDEDEYLRRQSGLN